MFPLRRLDDRMGQDMQDWCDVRLAAASEQPYWLGEAAKYYYNQVNRRIKDDRVLEGLCDRRDSVVHKIDIVGQISGRADRKEIYDALQCHTSTRGKSEYSLDDLDLLARRLVSDAQNELHLFLAYLYHLGFRKLLMYPFRPQGQVRRIQ